jgi:glutamyl-tRNA reductase
MLDNCFVFGFNHQNTSESDRSRVALTEELTLQLMTLVDKSEISSLIVLNTCNRTECYGYGNSEHLKAVYFKLMRLEEEFRERFMLLNGLDALKYIFSVAAGLQSQIIGDLEILGQFKNACKVAKKHGLIDGYFERLVNTCLQAAKEVRSETKITNGTVSLSYAAIKLLNKLGFNNQSTGRVLMLGTGAFGKNIARDLSVFCQN